MGLTKLAITRPVTMLMLMLLSVIMGIAAYTNMRQELNPEVNFGVITITTLYPGAGPDEVNTLVSRKLEESLSGVGGVREVTSTSVEGVSAVVAQFEIGTNMDEALNEARAKVDQVVVDLPRAALRPTLNKLDGASEPVLSLALSSQGMSARDLRDLADDKLKERFARIKGVGSVNVSGGDLREIQVQVRPDRLLAYGIGVVDVQRAIQFATLNVPSGRIVTPSQEFAVRVLGEFKTVADIEDMVLSVEDRQKQGAKPVVVRLGDLATVKDAAVERRSYSRLNGSDSVILTIQKSRDGNAIEIARAAEAAIKSMKTDFNVDAVKTFNQAVQVEESLFDLGFALFFGIFLVTLIVYIFLHNFRGTLIVGIAIPLCLFIALFVLWGLGFTINNMSMLALSLAIGVLVDDAIVVLENIYRHLRMGENPVEAAINGRSEIGLAAIAITLADVVVFIPIAFMGGVVGQFFKPLGIGFAVATLASLFVSFTITPMLASRWYRPGEDVEHFEKGFPLWFERNFKKLEERYRRTLDWSLHHRWFVFTAGWVALVGVFLMIAGSFAPNLGAAIQTGMPMFILSAILGGVVFIINLARRQARAIQLIGGVAFGAVLMGFAVLGFGYAQWKGEAIFKFAFAPPSDTGRVTISLSLPPGSTLTQTQAVIEQIEKVAMAHPDAKYVVANVGNKGGGGFAGTADTGSNYGEVIVTLNERTAILDTFMFWVKHESKLRSRAQSSVAGDLLQSIGKIPGAEYTVATGDQFGFGAPIQMSLTSDDRELLQRTAQNIRRKLEEGAVRGVITPELSTNPGKPELRAVPDRVRLADLGLSTADVANTMRMLYEGNDDTKFRVFGKEYDIRVMMDLETRNDPEAVVRVPITFVQSNPVYLNQVASIEEGQSVDKINRRNRETEILIETNLLPGFAAGTVQAEIDQWLAKEKLVPEGVSLKPLGQADVQAREGQYLFGALFIGLALVYMLLASLYENLLYPFIIQLTQPQAMVGALLGLILTDKTLNIVGFIGIIALVGLVGKNAILLVDYTNTLRERGRLRSDALLEAGPTRLRPILMTTLALILGMLPVALAIGRGSEFRETIGITIIGGITLSTVLTLLVIPCSYTIFDDLSIGLSKLLKRIIAWLTGRKAQTEQERYESPPNAGE